MDFATLVGLISGMLVVLFAILLGGDFASFLDMPSFLIVVGGGLAATVLRFRFADVVAGFATGMKIAFSQKKITSRMLIDEIEGLARIARVKGLIALDGVPATHDFLKKGVQLCVDGLTFEFIQDALTRERDLFIERLEEGEKVFRAIGEAAPAFGMIGTLIGLVQMLSNMQDPSSIGPAMAVALLTTLYGALIASLVALPIADKMAGKIQTEYVNLSLVIEGILQIQSKQSPDMIVEFLNAYVPEEQRRDLDARPAAAAA